MGRLSPVVILDKITSNLPHAQVAPEIKELFQNFVLADPTFHIPSASDMLIGAELFGKIVTGSRLTFRAGLPVAMNSRFGFIIIGSAPSATSPHPSHSRNNTLLTTTDVDLHSSLQLFW